MEKNVFHTLGIAGWLSDGIGVQYIISKVTRVDPKSMKYPDRYMGGRPLNAGSRKLDGIKTELHRRLGHKKFTRSEKEIEYDKMRVPYSRLILQIKKHAGSGDEHEIYPRSTLQWAVYFGEMESVKFFAKDHAFPERVDYHPLYNVTCLHIAAGRGHKELIKLLLPKGADLQTRAEARGGYTPLHYAVHFGHMNCIEILLDCGADINRRDRRCKTALDVAVEKKHKEIQKYLKSKGARSGELRDIDKKLIDAAGKGELAIVKKLVEEGADVNSHWQITNPLLYAVLHNRKEVLSLLLDNGADVKLSYHNADTLLNVAVEHASKEIVEILIKAGAGLNKKRPYKLKEKRISMTPLDLAGHLGKKDIAEIIKKHGGLTSDELEERENLERLINFTKNLW